MSEPRRDWPDVLPDAFVIIPRKAPYAIGLAAAVLVLLGLAALASGASAGTRFALLVAAATIGLAGSSLLFRLLQAGKPQLIADAAGVKTTLTPRRIPWDRIERVRIMPNRVGGSARVGVVPVSLDEALSSRTDTGRVIKLLESRQRREGAPFVVSLATSGISPDQARTRLLELAADRAPVTG